MTPLTLLVVALVVWAGGFTLWLSRWFQRLEDGQRSTRIAVDMVVHDLTQPFTSPRCPPMLRVPLERATAALDPDDPAAIAQAAYTARLRDVDHARTMAARAAAAEHIAKAQRKITGEDAG